MTTVMASDSKLGIGGGDVGSRGETQTLAGLKKVLTAQSHLFTCGGAVPIRGPVVVGHEAEPVPSSTAEKAHKQDNTATFGDTIESDPIVIRWDAIDGPSGSSVSPKLTLPLEPGKGADLERFVQQALPATFGREGKDVYDESYRKALQMDASAFCSTFNPYELGIVDEIAQVLLPSTVRSPTHRAVRAQLYKLNVYSGPSGKFRPHIDTPRSSSHFGSLVVCLPATHEGGQLQVRHKGEEMTFDWSTSKQEDGRARLFWAAFYGDCEHEVLEVASGHRLTLTYNLYAVRGVGRLTGVCPTLDPTSLPLFQVIKTVLKGDPFDGQGGKIGFFCSHAYAHTQQEEVPLLDTLKGVDMVLWESFRALGLGPRLVPVLRVSRGVQESFLDEYEDKYPEPPASAVQAHADWEAQKPPKWVIGRRFPVYIDDNWAAETQDHIRELWNAWLCGGTQPKQGGNVEVQMEDPRAVRWLTEPGHRELQLVYTAYGNEASTDAMYSHCAILVDIPPAVGNSGAE